ncbi:T9SS type A sorting domain-containing protein [candidate division KSB1 bacterium]|nr:T9SS type A sorting domain-containing protein [candidate division KSB1 bacterium]
MSVILSADPTVYDNSFNTPNRACIYTSTSASGHFYNNELTSGYYEYIYLTGGTPDVGGNGSGRIGNKILNSNNKNNKIFYITGGTPDLGNASSGDDGNNSLNVDQDTNAYYVYNLSGNTIKAEENWWGTSSPSSSKYYGSVDYYPYLTSNPHLSKSLSINHFARAKVLKRQKKYKDAYNSFYQSLKESFDPNEAAYALSNMFSCAQYFLSPQAIKSVLQEYRQDFRVEVQERATICLGELYARTNQLVEAENILTSLNPGSPADREALLLLHTIFALHKQTAKLINLEDYIKNRRVNDKYLEYDFSISREISNYAKKEDYIYSNDAVHPDFLHQELNQNTDMDLIAYPNPFNPMTSIRYTIRETVFIQIDIYNIIGQKIKTLIDTKLSPGTYTVKWNGRDEFNQKISSGVYFLKMTTPKNIKTIKLIFTR